MPRSSFILRQATFNQSLSQIAADTYFFVVPYEARDRLTVLQKHKGDVLIVRAVPAVGEIARSFCGGYARFSGFLDRVNGPFPVIPVDNSHSFKFQSGLIDKFGRPLKLIRSQPFG
jgi:hypothetical protein